MGRFLLVNYFCRAATTSALTIRICGFKPTSNLSRFQRCSDFKGRFLLN